MILGGWGIAENTFHKTLLELKLLSSHESIEDNLMLLLSSTIWWSTIFIIQAVSSSPFFFLKNWIESNNFCNNLLLGALPSLKGLGKQFINTASLLSHPFHHADSFLENHYQSGLCH